MSIRNEAGGGGFFGAVLPCSFSFYAVVLVVFETPGGGSGSYFELCSSSLCISTPGEENEEEVSPPATATRS
jgi:hypothetical protein